MKPVKSKCNFHTSVAKKLHIYHILLLWCWRTAHYASVKWLLYWASNSCVFNSRQFCFHANFFLGKYTPISVIRQYNLKHHDAPQLETEVGCSSFDAFLPGFTFLVSTEWLLVWYNFQNVPCSHYSVLKTLWTSSITWLPPLWTHKKRKIYSIWS